MSRQRRWLCGSAVLAVCVAVPVLNPAAACASAMTVRVPQRPYQQMMAVRTEGGAMVATGAFSQSVDGDVVTMQLSYRFLDGSVDEETTVYRQQGTYQLIRDHHFQRGPFFTRPFDFQVDVQAGAVTTWTLDSGTLVTREREMALPGDLANGILGTLLLNDPQVPFTAKVMVPFNGGRVVKLRVSRDGTRTMQLDGEAIAVTVYRVHPDLGGMIGVLAGLLGLKPKDVLVSIRQGAVPVVLRTVGQLGGYGPVLSVDVETTTFGR